MNKNILFVKDFHNSTIKVITLFLFIILNSVSFAAPQQEFGYVNVIDCMMLHPTMQYFDLGSKRFNLKALKGINIEERIEQNKIVVRKELEILKEQLKELEDKKKEIQETYEERRNNLLKPGEKLSLMTRTKRNMYYEKKAQLDAKMDNELSIVRREEYPITQNIKKLEDSSKYSGFSTIKETRDLFSLMLDDVYDAVNTISKRRNLAFIFNSSATLNYIESGESIFKTIPNCLPDFFNNYDESTKEKGESEAEGIMGGALTYWLYERDKVFKNCSDRRLSTFVISGGINLTSEVIDYLYEKHKIGDKQRKFIKDYYKKIMLPGTEGHRDF